MKNHLNLVFIILLSLALFRCVNNAKNINNPEQKIVAGNVNIGDHLVFQFKTGKYHNHPTFVIWVEDMEGNYLHPLYVTRSVSSGIWDHGELAPGKWSNLPGKAVRPAALPYWFHRRGLENMPAIPNENDRLPDAITSATPTAGFFLETKSGVEKGQKYRILIEINQTWDWNDYWHNNKFPDDNDYKNSCQPALIYAVTIDSRSSLKEYYFNPVGHGHYSGKNGVLYTDLSRFTTALEIFEEIKVVLK